MTPYILQMICLPSNYVQKTFSKKLTVQNIKKSTFSQILFYAQLKPFFFVILFYFKSFLYLMIFRT